MKKQNAIGMLAIAVALAGCSADSAGSAPASEAVPIRLTAGVSASQTRAADATKTMQASVFDDGVKVLVQVENTEDKKYPVKVYTVQNESGVCRLTLDAPQYFPSTGNGEAWIYAVYPSSYTTAAGQTVDITTASGVSNQQYTVGTNTTPYTQHDVMYGSLFTDNTLTTTRTTPRAAEVPLTFKHMMSRINVRVVADASLEAADKAGSTTVTLLNVKPQTTFAYSKAGGSIAPASATGTPIQVKLNDYDLTNIAATNFVSAIIPPQTVAAGTDFIQIGLPKGGQPKAYAIPTGGITFQSGYEYNYTLTVGLYAITVTATINAWGQDANVSQSGDVKL